MKVSLVKSKALRFVLVVGIMSFFADFTAGYGIFWFLGSALLGILYSISMPGLIIFSVVAELAAIPLFVLVSRQSEYEVIRA